MTQLVEALRYKPEGRVCGADDVARHHPHRTHYPRSGSQDHHPSKNPVQQTICFNSTYNAPDDGRMYPKHVALRIHKQNHLVASSWHFKLFHKKCTVSYGSRKFLQQFVKILQVVQWLFRWGSGVCGPWNVHKKWGVWTLERT